jgi:hypothetical protein
MGPYPVTRCVVVMQPTFLPWAGYFNLMAQADDFVFLDDVQLEKQSWQTRNRLIFGSQAHWIVVPVRHTHLAQTIADTEVLDSSRWRAKLATGFTQNYGRHPYFADANEIVDVLLEHPATRLAELNEAVIRFIAGCLGVAPRLHRASSLDAPGVRSGRLVALCKMLGAQDYLSPVGSAEYLEEDHFTDHLQGVLRFQEYTPCAYPQRGMTQFVSHLSIVDVVANLGWKSARYYVQEGVV